MNDFAKSMIGVMMGGLLVLLGCATGCEMKERHEGSIKSVAVLPDSNDSIKDHWNKTGGSGPKLKW